MTLASTLHGLRVLSLESRRRDEMAALISKLGGVPTVAPSVREVPEERVPELDTLVRRLQAGEQVVLVCMTGVGTRFLLRGLSARDDCPPELLGGAHFVARGNKPLAVLREHGLSAELVAAPHTWREVRSHLLARQLRGRFVTVIEVGEPTPPELERDLARAGAILSLLPVYRWGLPDDLAPLQQAVRDLADGHFDALLLTSGVQASHAFAVARELGLERPWLSGLARTTIASIGPACSEALGEFGVTPDIEANPHRMGALVQALAAHVSERARKVG